MYTNMADSEPKSAVEYLEDTVNFDTSEVTKNTCVVETRDDIHKGGVPDDMISFNDLVVLIVLYHGLIKETIQSSSIRHPDINSTDFPHVTNLANITLAPAGMVNLGTETELPSRATEINTFLQESIIRGFQSQIDDIKGKADAIIQPSTNLRSSTYYKLCDYCIDFAYKAYDGVTGLVSGLVGYTFKGMLRVCRSKLFPMTGGAPPLKKLRSTPSLSSPSAYDFKMSPDLCVVIFDNVRRSIKEADYTTFPTLCGSISAPSELCISANQNAGSRCRILNVIKGFGDQTLLPFVNKYLAYSSVSDEPLKMGVVKLTFSIDANGNVTIKSDKYDPLLLMDKIKVTVVEDYTTRDKSGNPQRVFWSSMKRCIEYCTRYDPGSDIELNHNNLTVLDFDLTCSSMSRAVDVPPQLNSTINPLRMQNVGGGGGVIKKNKSSRKRIRTRKIKNRSTNVKYLRNRRNVKKVKRKTKKVRRTYRK